MADDSLDPAVMVELMTVSDQKLADVGREIILELTSQKKVSEGHLIAISAVITEAIIRGQSQ